jgi:hypothetical protein
MDVTRISSCLLSRDRAWQLINPNKLHQPIDKKMKLCYFGTLKMAMRLLPKLIVLSNVPTNTRFLPLRVASLQPFPFVIFWPLRAFCPLIDISLAI